MMSTKPALRLSQRLASLGLAVVLFTLTGFAIWAGLTTQQVTAHVSQSVRLSQAYERARHEIDAEESLARQYRLVPSQDTLDLFREAGAGLEAALQSVRREGDARDRTLVATVLAAHAQYLNATILMFDLADAGQTARVAVIAHDVVDPAFSMIEDQVNAAANAHRVVAQQSLTQLTQTQGLMVAIMSVVLALSLVLGGLWMIVQRYQARLTAVTRAELQRLERAALTDNLTSLGNHRAFQEEYQSAVTRSSADGVALVRIDVDEFKVVNDQHGHSQGDRVLVALAKSLRQVDGHGRAYRLGGDDFAVVAPVSNKSDIIAIIERIRQEAPHRLQGSTVSIGIAVNPATQRDADILIEEAEAALAEAKRRGRNTLVTFDEIQEGAAILSSAKAGGVRRLLAERQVRVAFQPIWDLGRGGMMAFEALTRLPPEYGLAGPQEAFDIAERLGRAHDLDAISREAILARAAELPSDSLLFLNLSPQSLDHDLLAGSALVRAVEAAGLSPGRVVLEITERSVARQAVVIREARRLRALGFKLALDDAGAGNAGLEMLSQLPVDFVKIDRAVVANALTDPTADAVLAAIVAFARKARSGVVAEGIETEEMLDHVRQAGAQYVQGYLLGRPTETMTTIMAVPEALIASVDRRPRRHRVSA